MSDVLKNTLWCEKYRPQTVDDCILPTRLKDIFKEMVSSGEIRHLLLVGAAGTGKTSLAKALCNDLGIKYMIINGSMNGNIDILRTTIQQFASTKSFSSKYKVVIIDEADYLNPNSTMPSLRNFIEEFSHNCRFILTANYANRIIDPIKSRCSTIEFSYSKEEKQQQAIDFNKRLKYILTQENINFDNKVLAQVLTKYFPDFRKVTNELQRYCTNGILNDSIITNLSNTNINQLFNLLKDPSKWLEMRKWVSENLDNDFHFIMRTIYDKSSEFMKTSSLPQLVLILSEYDEKNTRCVDPEINLVAMLTQIISDCEFK